MKKIFLSLMVMCILPLYAFNVTGRVIDKYENGIEGVSVVAGERAVVTSRNGFFKLKNINLNERVFIHKIGYKDIYILPDRIGMQIIMERDFIEVPGYKLEGELQNLGEIKTTDKLIIKNDDNSATNAAELLENNVEIKGSELLGSKRTVSLGGNKSKHTLVMLDGVALNMNGEDFDIASIPAAIIKEIEILPNNAGAIGGSGAIGGIVNIITREKMKNNTVKSKRIVLTNSNNFKVGSFGLRKIQTQLSATTPIFQAYTTYSKAESDNDFEYYNKLKKITEKRENNRSEIEDFTLMLNSKYKYFKAKYNLIYQDYYKELPSSINVLTLFDGCFKEGVISKQIVDFVFQKGKCQMQSKSFFNKDLSDYDNTHSSGYLKQANRTEFDKAGTSLSTSYIWEKIVNLSIAGDYEKQEFHYKEKISSSPSQYKFLENYAFRSSVNVKYSLFPIDYEFSWFGRYDMPQKNGEVDFDSEYSNRFDYQISYRNWFQLLLGGSFGNSYQLPSFYDLHWKEGSQAVGNPDLLPEKSSGWNIYYKFEIAENFIKLSYQYNEVDDLIRWYRSMYFWKPGNIGSAEITNYQVFSELNLINDIKLNFSWQRTFSINKSLNQAGEQSSHYNKNIVYTPTSFTSILLEIPIYNFTWISSYNRTGRQWTTDDNFYPAIKAYEIIDSKIAYNITKDNWSFSADFAMNNVFDKEYEVSELIPKPKRNWSSGLNIEYKY
jgi:outer membrane cobalamin receptor